MKLKFLAILPLFLCVVACSQANNGNTNDNIPEQNEKGWYLYTLNVEMPDGTPATLPGLKAQWCDTQCSTPILLENGSASAYLENGGNYHAHVLGKHEGYTYDVNRYTANDTNRVTTIKFIELKNPTSGDGKQATPYVVTEGAYEATIGAFGGANVVWYTLIASKAGSYSFESIYQDDAFVLVPLNPVFYYKNDSGNAPCNEVTVTNLRNIIKEGNVLEIAYTDQFKSKLAAAGDTVTFGVFVKILPNQENDAITTDKPAKIDFIISCE